MLTTSCSLVRLQQVPANATTAESSPDIKNTQSVLYVLAVSAIILAAITAAHVAFNLLHSRISRTKIGPSLRLPRFEVSTSFLLLPLLSLLLARTLELTCGNHLALKLPQETIDFKSARHFWLVLFHVQ